MIFKYEIINPVTNPKKPFYDFKHKLFVFSVDVDYKYYIECARNNESTGGREYFLLLSDKFFDDNCRKCRVDDYGRCKINIRGEIKDYIIDEIKNRGNVEVNYISSEDGYDIYQVV